MKRNRLWVLGFVAVISAGVAVAVVLKMGWTVDDAKLLVESLIEEVKTWPAWAFFLAIAIGPLVAVPISPLVIIAAVRFGIMGGIFFSLAGLAINVSLGYWVARYPFHGVIAMILKRWNYSIPKAKPENSVKMTFLVRLSGAPLVFQNYILGLAHVRFWPYLWASLVIQIGFTVGFSIFGESFLSGKFGKALIGIVILALAFVGVSFLKKRLRKGKGVTVDAAAVE